jgi:uncharacterized membrane protein YkvA (DUF1232 family)
LSGGGALRTMAGRLRAWARATRRDAVALYLAARDPRVPWPAKAVAVAVAAYALSPIDLIPDFIPVLGLLDDLLLVPLGIVVARRLVPADLLEEHRRAAERLLAAPRSRAAAVAIVVVWSALALAAIAYLVGSLSATDHVAQPASSDAAALTAIGRT